MKKLAFIILLLPGFILSQTISLLDIVHERKSEPFIEVSANQNGGQAIFNRTYRGGCVGSYDIKWTFSKDLSTLQPGESFNVTLMCISCQTPCGYKWGIADAGAANNVRSVEGFPDYKYNGNIGLKGTSGASSGVFDWSPAQLSNTYTFQYDPKKVSDYTAFYITIAGQRINYVFGQGSAPATGAINCHALLGLGKLVNSLMLGAHENYPWDWMDETIDYAMNHIYSIGCLSDSYLKSLKSRIYRAANTQSFYDEILSYSQKLETEVASSCKSCSSCTN
ncbi:hypothetical protein [Muriicola sp. Z0-33]|uniref:hypothetical protein n=1 Tax=Muriicola sp. Z0-33 TaxID=2816957 RepID=UPI00223771F8|nr:hypothetical protein [Muriicola sp. Z0-33]MCW5517312.1 hypothetical protein [Muriicola sp. Z0-33]